MLDEHIALVKNQIDYYRQQLERERRQPGSFRPSVVALYERLIQRHQDLMMFLEGLSVRETSVPEFQATIEHKGTSSAIKPAAAPAALESEVNTDLPVELLQQLSGQRRDADPVVDVIAAHGATATLDEILIGLYRKTGEIAKRNILANRLYRLSKQGKIWIVPHRKGVYTTIPPVAAPKTMLEMAEDVRRYLASGWSREKIAGQLGYKSVGSVSNLEVLASAPSVIKRAVEDGKLSASEAITLARTHGDKAAEVWQSQDS